MSEGVCGLPSELPALSRRNRGSRVPPGTSPAGVAPDSSAITRAAPRISEQGPAPLVRNVLVVDDARAVRSALVRALSGPTVKVFATDGVADAFQILLGSDIDMVIADTNLPAMSGVTFLERVRRLYPETVRVLITGQRSLPLMRDAINRAGVSYFLGKPWDRQSLRDLMRCLPDLRAAQCERIQQRPAYEAAACAGPSAVGVAIASPQRAITRLERLLIALNGCEEESAIVSLLCAEFARCVPLQEIWWIDASQRGLRILTGGAARFEVHSLDTAPAGTRRLLERVRRTSRVLISETQRSEVPGTSSEKTAFLALPIQRRGRDLATLVLLASSLHPLAGLALDLAEGAALAIGVALARVRRQSWRMQDCVDFSIDELDHAQAAAGGMTPLFAGPDSFGPFEVRGQRLLDRFAGGERRGKGDSNREIGSDV